MDDEWRRTDYSVEYEVNRRGDVRRVGSSRLVARYLRRDVICVSLRAPGKYWRQSVPVAMAVMKAFGPPRPSSGHMPKHLDDDWHNCTLENLEWAVRPSRSNPYPPRAPRVLGAMKQEMRCVPMDRPCSKCGGPRTHNKHSWCAPCRTKAFLKWRAENPEKAKEQQRASNERRRLGTTLWTKGPKE